MGQNNNWTERSRNRWWELWDYCRTGGNGWILNVGRIIIRQSSKPHIRTHSEEFSVGHTGSITNNVDNNVWGKTITARVFSAHDLSGPLTAPEADLQCNICLNRGVQTRIWFWTPQRLLSTQTINWYNKVENISWINEPDLVKKRKQACGLTATHPLPRTGSRRTSSPEMHPPHPPINTQCFNKSEQRCALHIGILLSVTPVCNFH